MNMDIEELQRASEPPAVGPGSAGRRQMWLLAGRLTAASLLLGGSLAFGGLTSSFAQAALRVLIALTFVTGLAVGVAWRRWRDSPWLPTLQVGWDLLGVTGLVYLFGGASSGFSFLYGVIILASALVLGSKATRYVAAASVLLFLLVSLGLSAEWIPAPPSSTPPVPLTSEELALSLLRNVVGLTLVGVLAATLASRLQQAGGRLRVVAQSAAGFARLNEDILRSLASGLLTTDLEGRISRINPAGATLLGGNLREFSGVMVTSVLPVPAEPTTLARGDGSAKRLDGSDFPVGFSCSPLRDAAGEVHGTLVLFQDLSELNQLRDQVQRAERLAALGRLSAGLAHEIRNPLGSISGSVELVCDAEGLGDEDKRLLRLVLGEVDRLNDLVTTMLDVGRPRVPELSVVDVGELAVAVAQLARRTPAVEVHVEDGPVRAEADPSQLRQVLWNLVKNAIQFSPADKPVTVRVSYSADGDPMIAVTDLGPGISEEDRVHLFDMFFSKRRHGVGLGLALVRQIVEAHRGEVTVESEVGAGSTFRVSLRPPPEGRNPY